jgi:hypothetical protein
MLVPFITHLPEAWAAKRASTVKLRKSMMTEEWLEVDCPTVRRRLDTTTDGDRVTKSNFSKPADFLKKTRSSPGVFF